jgi:signal peptidase I
MIFTPRHIKEGKHYRHALKRLIHYKEDILPEKDLATLRSLLADMQAALKSRKREAIDRVQKAIEKAVGRIVPPSANAGWRENVEVFLVAIVIAAGVRAYFLQPFKIPTGSMQPTLFGIVGTPSDKPTPNLLIRAFDLVCLGRHHIDLRAKGETEVRDLKESTYLNFFTFTQVICNNGTYRLFAPQAPLQVGFGIKPGKIYADGEIMAHGTIDTGDQVFVDKISYNFRKPNAGDVFVFKTTGIPRISMPRGVDSQHYIKRLVGLPEQTLRIDAPQLFIDGQLAENPLFQRVMSEKNGYRGYSNPSKMQGALYLTNPDDSFTLPVKTYFALGDNSYKSSDSRFWGTVPEQNVAGRGFVVYWPFSKRWGLIH